MSDSYMAAYRNPLHIQSTLHIKVLVCDLCKTAQLLYQLLQYYCVVTVSVRKTTAHFHNHAYQYAC